MWLALPLLAACTAENATRRDAPDRVDPTPAIFRPVPLPHPRHGHRIERLACGLLCFGGFAESGGEDRGTRQAWWLQDGSDRWQRRADLAVGRAFFGSAQIDGAVFALGDGAERYDAAADRWVEVLPPGTLPKSHFATATLGRTVYLLGGYPTDRSGFLAVDLDTASIRHETPPPGFGPGDHFHFLYVFDGRLHAIGGLDSSTFQPRTEHCSRTENGWRAEAPPPSGLWAKFAIHGVAAGRLYLFGDFGGWCFDPVTGEWTARGGPERLLAMPATVAVGGDLWVLGGVDSTGPRRAVLLRYDARAEVWSDLLAGDADPPSGVAAASGHRR